MNSDKISVLDYGYVQYIEHFGSDERIIESARMSTDGAFKGWGPLPCPKCSVGTLVWGTGKNPTTETVGDYIAVAGGECTRCKGTGRVAGDEGLLRHLYTNHHLSPFEMAGVTIEVQAPIFVFREWHRHRTQSYNEMSARYTPLPDFNYLPTPERCLLVHGTNKQAGAVKGSETVTHANAIFWLELLEEVYQHAEEVYQKGLAAGIPKEVARLPVPVARYSRMRAATDLRNWLGFLSLRMDEHAQWEIRQFANVVGEQIIKPLFPKTWDLFTVNG